MEPTPYIRGSSRRWAIEEYKVNNGAYSKDDILSAIRETEQTLGKPLSRAQFMAHSGITEYHVLKWFHSCSWNAAERSGLRNHGQSLLHIFSPLFASPIALSASYIEPWASLNSAGLIEIYSPIFILNGFGYPGAPLAESSGMNGSLEM